MNNKAITSAGISAAIGVLLAWITITKFSLEPLETRLNTARENFLRTLSEREARFDRAMSERDARFDYLQLQIDVLERRLSNGEKK